ncbi:MULTISPECIES: AraC family transcriptional regulator [Pseudomonas]|uniref:Helix-turn-helix domain-containing protein n=2 Tax=unclassified Pseudomonas TaxID=196821 RepID=A0AB39I5U5_9PSED|nr:MULTISPECIES: AraC family transcriptional regulator [Pseudomonas]KJK07759.1 AraC family transcriptional regulator [Pseudomonas sp. 5]MDD1977033.1 AraC family transcriptional regulator [Pseudomonas putida]MDH2558295.1 AraC family transcriptional regulator ligand-binding domain-containing protein [Pseudomonas sp. Hg5Tf]QYX48225.1 AraC family transcriptional regulator [Pseudomonas sp. S11A 273]
MLAEAFVSSAFTRTLVAHAQGCGLPVERLLAHAGIDSAWLDGHHRVPALRVEQLLAECEAAGAGREFGCELVPGMATHSLQGLNILLDSAATVRASLECFIRYLPLVTNCVRVSLEEDAGQTLLHVRRYQHQPHYYMLDAAVLSLVRNIARRAGKPPASVFTQVTLLAQQAAWPWLQEWGVPTAEGQWLSLQLAPGALALALPGANAFLHQSMLRQWQGAVGDADRQGSLQLARHWLAAGDQPIERIATRLGYRQPSNFIRAFRKQFGVTPKQFRLSALQSA